MSNTKLSLNVGFQYHVECLDKDGNLKWTEDVHNTTVTAGLNHLLNTEFKSGTQVTSWFLGLKGAGTIAAADTNASHAGWAEVNPYTGNRPAITLGTVSGGSVDNTGAVNAFAITSGATVAGAYVVSVNTGTTGTLYGAADFTASRTVASGDTLNVTVTLSAVTA